MRELLFLEGGRESTSSRDERMPSKTSSHGSRPHRVANNIDAMKSV